jgi:hypothetical protein
VRTAAALVGLLWRAKSQTRVHADVTGLGQAS